MTHFKEQRHCQLVNMEPGTLRFAASVLILSFLRSTESLECPPGAIVTTLDDGRLGNLAWEYASVWALAKYLPCHRTPYSTGLINRFLNQIFENVSLTAVDALPRDCRCFSYGNISKHN